MCQTIAGLGLCYKVFAISLAGPQSQGCPFRSKVSLNISLFFASWMWHAGQYLCKFKQPPFCIIEGLIWLFFPDMRALGIPARRLIFFFTFSPYPPHYCVSKERVATWTYINSISVTQVRIATIRGAWRVDIPPTYNCEG